MTDRGKQDVIIRPYQDDDWPAACQIHDLARPVELAGSCDPRAFVPLADDPEDLAEFNSANKSVAMLVERVAGFVGVEGDQVGWLYVHPDLTGQGIGRQLLRHAISTIEGNASVHVLEGNSTALSLYDSEGFRFTEKFKGRNNGYPCVVIRLSQ
jgi:ribosomal protein S18 acetylase RimI-like enzyme